MPETVTAAVAASEPEAVLPASSRMRRWIEILEDLVRIPFTRLTFGLDVVLGIVPVVGDFAGLICGLPILATAVRRRLPFRVLLVMLANVLLDAVVGSVPVLGNVFDLLWKAHRRNLQLLESPGELSTVLREARGRLAALAAVVFLLLLALVGLMVGVVWLYIRLLGDFRGLLA